MLAYKYVKILENEISKKNLILCMIITIIIVAMMMMNKWI